MIKLPKSVLPFGAGALALGALIVAAPRAAHAIAATLVQVTNTSASPAVAQDVSRMASQNVQLISSPSSANGPTANAVAPGAHVALYQMFPNGDYGANPFVVPAGQSLIITSISLSLEGSYAAVGIGNTSNAALREQFSLTATSVFSFPSGVVFPAGDSIFVQNYGASSAGVIFTLHGYLTSN
jgi:hypothetical protein